MAVLVYISAKMYYSAVKAQYLLALAKVIVLTNTTLELLWPEWIMTRTNI